MTNYTKKIADFLNDIYHNYLTNFVLKILLSYHVVWYKKYIIQVNNLHLFFKSVINTL